MPFGVARLEQLLHARQAARDVHVLRATGRPRGDLLAVLRLLSRRTLRTPPVWNVRIVSCVPGSPIDCAATIPTASPISTTLRRPRCQP